jgi:hypothetical protein
MPRTHSNLNAYKQVQNDEKMSESRLFPFNAARSGEISRKWHVNVKM